MTPLPPVTNVLKYTQDFHIGSNLLAECIFHFQYTGGPPSAGDCQTLAADIQGSAATNFKTHMSNLSYVGLGTVLDLNSDTGADGQGGTVTEGTLSTLANPASTALVVNHSIARRYRGGKPRSYLPFGTANELNSPGTWTSTFASASVASFGTWITACLAFSSGGTSISEYVSVSYFSGGAMRVTPHVDPIVNSLPRTRVGTQRRRNKTA